MNPNPLQIVQLSESHGLSLADVGIANSETLILRETEPQSVASELSPAKPSNDGITSFQDMVQPSEETLKTLSN